MTQSNRWGVKLNVTICTLILSVLGVWWALGGPSGLNAPSEISMEQHTVALVRRIKVNNIESVNNERTAGVFGSVHSSNATDITDARVCASCGFPQCGSPGPAELSCVSTDQQGRFELRVTSSGRYGFFASAPKYPTVRATFGTDSEHLLHVDPTQSYTIDFILQEGGVRVSGSVTDALGGPIEKAEISASAPELTQVIGGITQSDEQGQFELFVEPGPLLLRASAAGYTWIYHPVTAPNESVELVLTPASQLGGVVVSAVDGSPVPDIEVRATKINAAVLTPGDGVGMSDSAGRFNIDGLSEGNYEVSTHSPRWYGRIPDKIQIGLAESDTSLHLEVRTGVSISGEIRVASPSEPCTEGIVALAAVKESSASSYQDTAQINSYGQFQFQAVPPGDFNVQVQCQGRISSNALPVLTVQGNDIEGLKWYVKRGLSITGRVVDSAGLPLAGRTVSAHPVNEPVTEEGFLERAIHTDEKGRFSITGLSSNSYYITVEGDRDTAQTVMVTDTLETSDLTLIVRNSAKIRVQVFSESDFEAALRIQATNGINTWQAQRSDAYLYELRALPAGLFKVYVSDSRNPPLTQMVELSAGDTRDLSFTLPVRLATLQGRLIDEKGNPLADVWLKATPLEILPFADFLPGASVLTGPDGSFRIANLSSAGVYDLIAFRGQKETVLQRGVTTDNPLLLILSSVSDPK